MKKRFLIVVGLPKSGTTYLFSEFSKRPDAFSMPVWVKEVDYFRRGADLDAYTGMFDPDGGDTIFDASPLYLDDLDTSAKNMADALKGHDVKIVVCLRDPLERAYSHYLHDIATNQKLLGHADYSFWSPPVLAKYLYLVAPRVKKLQSMFGAENVHAFMFGQDMGPFQNIVRDFTGLGQDWSLDMGSNPAPGFTSPQSFFHESLDTEIRLGTNRYLLPKEQLLVVNRQYSILRKAIHPTIGTQIVQRQATLTRQFDTGLLSDDVRARVFADMEDAADALGLSITFDRAPRIMVSKLSEQAPDKIIGQLKCLGSVDDGFTHLLEHGEKPTTKLILSAPDQTPSLAREMARLQLAVAKDPIVTETMHELQDKIINSFGPTPYYMESRMHRLVAYGKHDEALATFDEFGGPRRLLWPMTLHNFLRARNIELPSDVAEKFEKAGIIVKQ